MRRLRRMRRGKGEWRGRRLWGRGWWRRGVRWRGRGRVSFRNGSGSIAGRRIGRGRNGRGRLLRRNGRGVTVVRGRGGMVLKVCWGCHMQVGGSVCIYLWSIKLVCIEPPIPKQCKPKTPYPYPYLRKPKLSTSPTSLHPTITPHRLRTILTSPLAVLGAEQQAHVPQTTPQYAGRGNAIPRARPNRSGAGDRDPRARGADDAHAAYTAAALQGTRARCAPRP